MKIGYLKNGKRSSDTFDGGMIKFELESQDMRDVFPAELL